MINNTYNIHNKSCITFIFEVYSAKLVFEYIDEYNLLFEEIRTNLALVIKLFILSFTNFKP